MLRGTVLSIAALLFMSAGGQNPAQPHRADLMSPMNASFERMRTMQKSGDLDRDFASMMAEHHRSGVEMAKIELQFGKDSVLRQMARSIITSQTREIHRLSRRSRYLARHAATAR